MIELTKQVESRFRIDSKKFNKEVNIEDRPILSNVHYSEEGHIEYTNSHVGIRLLDVYEGEEQFKHGLPIEDGIYPDLGKVFKNYEDLEHIKLPTKKIEDILQPFVNQKFTQTRLTIKKNELEFEFRTGSQKEYAGLINLNLDINEEFKIAFHPNYLYDTFRFFRLLKIKEVEFYYGSPIRPVFLVHENLEAVISPQRM